MLSRSSRSEPLVSRSALRVRPAGEQDLPVLVELGSDLREALLPVDGARPATPAGRAVLEERFRAAIASPDRMLVLVVGDDDEPLGMALFTVAPANALLDAPALHMTHAVVPDRHRRRGAGRALVAAAAALADERGLDQVVVSVRPGSRDANRFFARLGFAPLAMRRAASVASIRRHLAKGDATRAGAGLTGAARRRARTGRVLAEVPEQPTPRVTASVPAKPEA